MLAIPTSILRKPEPLTAEEWSLIRQHPAIGERIMMTAPALTAIATLVRHTHERWDGTGYPDQLRGDLIPVGARIIAIAEAFDAMTRPQPFRRAHSRTDTEAELRRCSGRQFDPTIVAAVAGTIATGDV